MTFIKKYSKEMIFVFLFGTLLHFTYTISNQNVLVGCFSAVNESVWEHLKLLVIPIFFLTLYEKGFLKRNCFYVNFMATVIGMAFTVISFYTYSGIIGRNFLCIDILLFLLSVLLVFFIKYVAEESTRKEKTGIVLFILLVIVFIFFTFFPPHIQLFMNSLLGTCGI